MKRRILTILSGLLIAIASLATHPVPTFAANDDTGTEEDAKACGGSVLGLRPWYYNICTGSGSNVEIEKPGNDESALPIFIGKIALNVLFDLSLIIGYLALAMIVFGGFQYIYSQGDPGKMAKGKKTLMAAVIGTTIALSASVVINTASAILGTSFHGSGINSLKGNTISTDTISNILNYAYSMAGLVAVAFIIKGGFDYVLSQGDPGKTAQGTRTLITAVVGLVIVILARLITGLVLTTTGSAL